MNVTHKNIVAFVTIAELGSFAEASERLFISQPALSTAIKNMEESIGGKLFSRSTRRVSLTPEGKEFLPVAKRLLNDWETALSDVTSLFKLQRGVLNIAAMPSFADGILATNLANYHNNNPNIQIRLLDEVMERVIQHVQDGRTELGFVFRPNDLTGLIFTPLIEDSFMLVVNKEHKYASYDRVEIEQLNSIPMVFMNHGSSIRTWIDNNLESLNIKPDMIAETSQFSTLGQMVANGMGVTIAPKICRQLMLSKGCVCVNFSSNEFTKEIGVLMKKRGKLSSAAQLFLKELSKNLRVSTTFS
ncbi:LysR family transcriptional regulator [Glaciecola sp. KUL10]|uniref:LysR family transcriptional regulator n=1 Tax=Glaciecola sp. (strain KUL10) TaxID=2161813 RepID=UPI000D918B46|nr:LysR family transcriptional regulator [Glaciecola sp. KUL10]GBL02765.1 transcriptional regulator [Glaciecola sp. KUL10]